MAEQFADDLANFIVLHGIEKHVRNMAKWQARGERVEGRGKRVEG